MGNDLGKCIYVGAAFEPNEFAFLQDFLRPGMTFVDIGANEGAYTVFAAQRVGASGRVLAVEPSERELTRLRENIALNRLANVVVVAAAAGDAEGTADLAVAEADHAGQNTIGRRVANPQIRTDSIERVPVRMLDALLEEHEIDDPDFVKIDAEGSEPLVLAGARGTLSSTRPILQLELEPTALRAQGSTIDAVLHELRALDYRLWIFDGSTGLLREASTAEGGNAIFAPDGWRPPPPHGAR